MNAQAPDVYGNVGVLKAERVNYIDFVGKSDWLSGYIHKWCESWGRSAKNLIYPKILHQGL